MKQMNVCRLLHLAVAGMFAVMTIAFPTMSQTNISPAPAATLANPRIVIHKSKRRLELFDGRRRVRSYAIVLGFTPKGDKEREGDGRTPEGDFYIFIKNPTSKFHLSLGVSYPDRSDAARGLAGSLITREEHDAIVKAQNDRSMPPQKTALGGEIYIHGGGIASDWTEGCIAMKNGDIEELYALVGTGAAVKIVP